MKMCSHFSSDLWESVESIQLSWVRKGITGVSGRSVGRTAVSCFDSAVLSWMYWPEDVRKKKKDETSLMQELLGNIFQGFEEIIVHLKCTFHLRIPSVVIHTWPWLQQLWTNSSAPTWRWSPSTGVGEGTCVGCHRVFARCRAVHTRCTNPVPAHHWKCSALRGCVSFRSSACWQKEIWGSWSLAQLFQRLI